MPCSTEGQTDRRLNQFDKIRTVEVIADRLAAKYMGPDFPAKMDAAGGIIPAGSFYEVINQAGVHKSLAGFTAVAEKRLAFAVTEILAAGTANLQQLSADLCQAGSDDAAPADTDVPAAFTWVTRRYLDGMPCDETMEILRQDEEAVIWQTAEDSHAPHWEAVNGDVENYYPLFLAYVNGLLSACGRTLTMNGRQFTLK